MKNHDSILENVKKYNYRASILLLIVQFVGIFLSILSKNAFEAKLIYYSIGFIVISLATNIFINYMLKSDRTIIFIINLLYSISLIMMIRLNPELAIKHIIWYFVGVIVMIISFIILKKSDKFFNDKMLMFFLITLTTFIITLTLGFTSGGAKNWISIAGFTFQPSEFAKITFIFFIATYYNNLSKIKEKKYSKYYLLVATYIFSALFFLQGELGTAIVFFAVMIFSIFTFEDRYLLIGANILIAFIGVFLASKVLPHIQTRFEIWLNPWKDASGGGYQIIQSLFAVASGGFFGTGIGKGSPNLIPVASSDFILAAIIEEMGIFIGVTIILMYILIFYKTIKMSLEFKNLYLSSLSLSIGVIISIQAILMFGGILKLLPLTGITTPFLSYGGSSTISNFILIGIFLYISSLRGEINENY